MLQVKIVKIINATDKSQTFYFWITQIKAT